ncbi:MAG: N-acetyltransferase [Pseudomonadota bacterium]
MPNRDTPPNRKSALVRLSVSDADRLATLHAASFAAPSAWSAPDFSRFLKLDTCMGLALVSDDFVLAFALFQGVAPETELLTLCTHPSHRQQGQAEHLLKAAENALSQAGFNRIFLEVSERNTAAISLYRKLGFICISTRESYYSNRNGNTAAQIMAKDFAGQT